MHEITKLLQKVSKKSLILVGQVDKEAFLNNLKINKEDLCVLQEPVIKISDVKNLVTWISYKPFVEKKLAIIFEAENMTSEAANALLKTLEEPPSYANILLIVGEEQKILPTIRSRCQIFKTNDFAYKPIFFDFPELKNYSLTPAAINQMSYSDRFKLAEAIFESGKVKEAVLFWQHYFWKELLEGKDVVRISKEISYARDLLNTNISVKLLLENLLINF